MASVDGHNPETETIKRERLTRLREHLALIDESKRELLAMRYAAELSMAEIAAVVGKSEAAVKKQLTRTIAKLKENYRDEPS
jgi:RNA polymerase sigma-70 factor, ECF subfamily